MRRDGGAGTEPLQQLRHPRTGRVDDHSGLDVEAATVQRIFRMDADHAVAFPNQGFRLHVVGHHGPGAGRRLDHADHQPFGVQRQPVVPLRRARDRRVRERRQDPEAFAARKGRAVGDFPRRIEMPVAVAAQDVVRQHSESHHRPAFQGQPARRHDARHGRDQVRSRPQQDAPLADGFQHARQIRLLQVAQAAMDDLQAVGRSARAKIRLFDQRRPQAARRRFARQRRAIDAAADDQHVVGHRPQVVQFAFHARISIRGK